MQNSATAKSRSMQGNDTRLTATISRLKLLGPSNLVMPPALGAGAKTFAHTYPYKWRVNKLFAGVDSKTNNAWCNISHKTILDDAWRDKIIMSFQSTQQLLLADIICDLRRPTNKSVTRHTFIMDNMNVTLCRLNWKPLYAIERGIGLKFRVNDVQNVYDYLNPFYGLAFAAFWVPYKPAKDHFNPLAVFENYVAETIKDSAKTPATERMSLLAAYYSSNLVSQP